jgi:peptide/nickel transport system substrate-binding protein
VITVTLDNADWASYRTHRINEDMDAYILGWYPDYVDPDNYVFPFLHSAGSSWIHHNYNNSQMDDLASWARGNTTLAVRIDLYEQIQTLMADDCPIVSLYQGSAFAVSTLNVKGIHLDITQNWRHWLVYVEE